MAFENMYMIPAEDANIVNLFKGRLMGDPTLDTVAKRMTRKLETLKNPQNKSRFQEASYQTD